MADAPVVHIGENSPQEVAYKLFKHIANVENKTFTGPSSACTADRDYILTTYARCLYTISNPGWVKDALKDNFGSS